MVSSKKNKSKPWTRSEVSQLKTLAKRNTPTRVISLKLGRTEKAVRSKAKQEGISLKPTNQSPYNQRSSAQGTTTRRAQRPVSTPTAENWVEEISGSLADIPEDDYQEFLEHCRAVRSQEAGVEVEEVRL
jgi:hypothetical protein